MTEEYFQLPKLPDVPPDGTSPETLTVTVRKWVVIALGIALVCCALVAIEYWLLQEPSNRAFNGTLAQAIFAAGVSAFGVYYAAKTYDANQTREKARVEGGARRDALWLQAIHENQVGWTRVVESMENRWIAHMEQLRGEMEKGRLDRERLWQDAIEHRDRMHRSMDLIESFNALEKVTIRTVTNQIRTAKKHHGSKKIWDDIEAQPSQKDAVTALLGIFEDISVFTQQRLTDEVLLFELLDFIVVDNVVLLEPYITEARIQLGDPRIYTESQKLANAWKEKKSVVDGSLSLAELVEDRKTVAREQFRRRVARISDRADNQ